MTWTKKKSVTAAILLLAVMMLPLLSNQAEATGINISVPTAYYKTGDIINATIICTPTTWIKAWEMKIVFSKNKLQANSITEGSFFKPGQTYFVSNINNTQGCIYPLYDLAITGNASQTKPLFYVLFTAKNHGQAYINLSGVGITNETKYLTGLIVSNTTFYVYSQWDLNYDKTVGMVDIMLVAGHYGQTGSPGWIKEDVDRNGMITLIDIVLIICHWGPY